MSDSNLTGLPAIERPNGKPYRPKRVMGRLLNEATDEPTLILVTGTHDTDRAAEFARELAAYWLGSDVEPVAPMRGWWRQSIRRGDEYWTDDDVRGAAGVIFSIGEAGHAAS
ncbi:MAG TPA: hypothetical protein VIZ43_08405 [Trebonia sp.]